VRRFDASNKSRPTCVRKLSLKRPACYAQIDWDAWLVEAWRSVKDDMAQRRDMQRLRPPSHCDDCTATYQARMRSESKCKPADPHATPLGRMAQKVILVVHLDPRKDEAPEQHELFEGP
jgi:hypothetical protein